MWKETLLQLLIALLPVFLFLVWYDRPGRTRGVPVFLSVFCAFAMILNIHFSVVLENGIHVDLRHVPWTIGALYGGVPAAVFLGVVYAVVRLLHMSAQWEYLVLATFMILFTPVLIRYSFSFLSGTRNRRYKVSIALANLNCLFFIVVNGFKSAQAPSSVFWQGMELMLVFWAVFLFATIAAVKFMEVGFDRVRLQRELRDMSLKYRGEMRRLQQFIDQAPLSVLIFDSEGFVTHVNDETLRTVKPLSRKNMVYQHYTVLQQHFGLESPTPVDRVLQGEHRVVEKLNFGARSCYTVTTTIKGAANQTEGILFICHDVTELEQLRDELGRMERLSLVGQMAASITHEIRNPMAVIRGFVQLLNERSPSELQSYFRIVMEELDRANGIINDFLSLAQNRIVEKQSCNLQELLNDLAPLLWADANMRGQVVDMRLSHETEPLLINSKEIKQLVLNLARNGMEAMNDKGVLRIETVNNDDTVQLRVADQGVGIPKEKLERLFEPFFTTKTNGTGLGLALCLSIVERHNAKIEVQSEVGVGTTFTVTFVKPGRHIR